MIMEPSITKKKVLIVDDHPLIRHGLREILDLTDTLTVCGEAECFNEALRVFHDTTPDVLIVDISLKGSQTGIDLVRQIREEDTTVPILCLSLYRENWYTEEAMQSGANGFISKNEDAGELVRAVETILRGRDYLSEEAQYRSRISDANVDTGNPLDSLSRRERQVYELIGMGHTSDEIAKKLCIAPKTLFNHRDKIRSKLALASYQELLQHATRWAIANEK